MLNELKKRVKEFERKAEFDKTDVEKLLSMLQEELDILKNNKDKKDIADHQIMDLQILILQIANRYGTDLDKECETWFKKSEKYVR